MDVYALVDPRDGRIRYVGLSKNFKRRLRAHRCPTIRDRFHNGHLCDWKDELVAQGLSFDAFQIGTDLTLAEAQAMERGYIKTFREVAEPILNVHDGGAPGNNVSPSAETCARMGAAHRGFRASAEVRARMSEAQRLWHQQRPMTPETKAKIREAKVGKKGKPKSPETCAKISASKRGKQPRPEHLAKLQGGHRAWREAGGGRGRKCTVETKAKISASNHGKKYSSEHRAKISAGLRTYYAANRGKKHTAETKAHLSMVRQAWWEAKRAKGEL